MARNANDVMTVEGNPTATQVQSLTFRTAADRPKPPYHFLLITVGPNDLPDGTVTGDKLDEAVNYWLESDYDLFQVDYITANKGIGGEFFGNVFAYHFVLK